MLQIYMYWDGKTSKKYAEGEKKRKKKYDSTLLKLCIKLVKPYSFNELYYCIYYLTYNI